MKRQVDAALNKPNSKYYFLVSDVLALATIVSIVAIVLETVPALDNWQSIFLLIEWTAVVIFSLEYAARLWVSKPWHRYSFSFYGLIDLVSVLPSLLGLGNLTFLKSARALRIIRLLRMVRLAKLSHIKGRDPEESIGVVGLNVMIYFVILAISLLATGTMMYVIEGSSIAFASIPTAMWWALKVFLGSIPVEVPLTTLGGVVYVLARFVGLLLLGLLIGVVGNIFRNVLLKKR